MSEAQAQLREYPRLIERVEATLGNLRRDLEVAKRSTQAVYDRLFVAHWQAAGSNNDVRNAGFRIILSSNVEYLEVLATEDALRFEIGVQEGNLGRLKDEFGVRKLEFRAAVTKMELFGGMVLGDERL